MIYGLRVTTRHTIFIVLDAEVVATLSKRLRYDHCGVNVLAFASAIRTCIVRPHLKIISVFSGELRENVCQTAPKDAL